VNRLIEVPADTPPILSVVVHTEEEFDWTRSEFDRNSTAVTHMRYTDRVQDIFDSAGIVPTYVVDYPIANQEDGWRPLRRFADEGRALIGAHLHPWVSPPYTEEITRRNSYPGNLPREVEHDKLKRLTTRITDNFGRPPKVYLAGRYGNGPNSHAILEELGYEVDISVNVPMDFTDDGGPDYSSRTNHPFWFGERRRLLGLCYTGAFVGWLPVSKRMVFRMANQPWLSRTKLPGILARLRMVDRLGLSPEGFHRHEFRRLTKSLLHDGFRVFVFYFHSPSVQPGCTPYVRTDADLRDFLGKCRDYFAFFKDELNGVAMTPLQIKSLLERVEARAGSTPNVISHG
jgi:hypothetical protein